MNFLRTGASLGRRYCFDNFKMAAIAAIRKLLCTPWFLTKFQSNPTTASGQTNCCFWKYYSMTSQSHIGYKSYLLMLFIWVKITVSRFLKFHPSHQFSVMSSHFLGWYHYKAVMIKPANDPTVLPHIGTLYTFMEYFIRQEIDDRHIILFPGAAINCLCRNSSQGGPAR